jgi:AcrR family transcriptional regulator
MPADLTDPQPEVPGTRDQLLLAAIETAAVHGINRLSMGDVAKRAGYSRPTLYKHFPSKDALVAAVVEQEAAVIVGAVLAAADRHEDPRQALEAAVLVALQLMREHPMLDRVISTEPEVLVPLLTTDGGPVLAMARVPVQAIIARRLPELDEVAARRLADLLTRLLVSYALSAPDDPPELVAAAVAAVATGGAAALAAHPLVAAAPPRERG